MRLEFAVARRNPGFRQALGQKPLRPDHPLGDVNLNSIFFFAKSRYHRRVCRAVYNLKPKGELPASQITSTQLLVPMRGAGFAFRLYTAA